MTAEFNITIPGAEIIKRLADLETQVRDLANERAIDKVLVNAHTDNIAGLIDRVDRLTDFLNGKPVQTTVAPPYASTSRVERIAEELADLRRELTLAIANGGEEIKQVNDRIERDNESIGAYIQRVETDLGERLTAVDRARARGDDGQHDLVTRTANKIYDVVWNLERRISDCELAVGTDKLGGAPTPNIPANDPEPLVDTSWHPFNFSVDLRPDDDKHVVILTRDDVIAGPEKPSAYYWGNDGDGTIVAWRYAKEGE